jgi:hypothetical protein
MLIGVNAHRGLFYIAGQTQDKGGIEELSDVLEKMGPLGPCILAFVCLIM